MEKEQMFLVGDADFTTILPSLDQVNEYVPGVLKSILETGHPVDLRIRTRPAAECKMFLDGAAPAIQPAQKEPPQRKAAPAKKQKKAVGGQTVSKADKPAAPAQVKKGSNRSLVLDFINLHTKETAVDLPAICKATKLKIVSVSPMLTELFKAGFIDRIEGKPLRFFKSAGKKEPVQPGDNQIMCKARGKVISIDICKPNDASPICRVCPNIEH